jgi:hypothetical protein
LEWRALKKVVLAFWWKKGADAEKPFMVVPDIPIAGLRPGTYLSRSNALNAVILLWRNGRPRPKASF